MSMLNYSKWDKLELSDDDEFECHPNVDKPSMIRWKQAKLHSDRRDKKDLIKILEAELEILSTLSSKIPEVVSENHYKLFVSLSDNLFGELDQTIVKIRSVDRDARWGPMEPIPTVDDRLQVAFFIRDKADSTDFEKSMLEIKSKIELRIDSAKKQIAEAKFEQSQKITSDNIFTDGFNKTIIPSIAPTAQATPSTSANSGEKTGKEKVIETIHVPSSTSPPTAILENPLLAHFATMNLENSAQYLHAYPQLISSDNSDLVLAQAFEYCQEGKIKKCKKCIEQGLVLSYCTVLSPRTFFSKIHLKVTIDTFMKDVEETFERIHKRVLEIKKEKEEKQRLEELEALERLQRSTMEDGSYKLQDPDQDRCAVFDTLCKKLQKGLLLGDVDIINEGLKEQNDEKVVAECIRVGLFEMDPNDE